MAFAFALIVANVTAQQATGVVAPGSMSGVGDAPTAGNQWAILVTTVTGFFTLIATQMFALWRESRNRKWDLEDRAAARKEMRHHADTQRLETVQTALDLAKVSAYNKQQLEGHIVRNTEITIAAAEKADAAYKAANNFNEKLEELRRQLTSKAHQVDNIEETTSDTQQKVTEIKEKLIP